MYLLMRVCYCIFQVVRWWPLIVHAYNAFHKTVQCTPLNLYLEKVDEVDGEDGPHAIVGEPFAGFHSDDEENPSENNQ